MITHWHSLIILMIQPNIALILAVTENETVVIINSLKSKNSSGKDEISIKLLKSMKVKISKPLTIIINQCLETGVFPDAVKVAKVPL